MERQLEEEDGHVFVHQPARTDQEQSRGEERNALIQAAGRDFPAADGGVGEEAAVGAPGRRGGTATPPLALPLVVSANQGRCSVPWPLELRGIHCHPLPSRSYIAGTCISYWLPRRHPPIAAFAG